MVRNALYGRFMSSVGESRKEYEYEKRLRSNLRIIKKAQINTGSSLSLSLVSLNEVGLKLVCFAGHD